MENNVEKELIEAKKQKDELVKEMLQMEWILGSITMTTFLVLIFIAEMGILPTTVSILLVVLSVIILGLGIYGAIRIEQVAGYYECGKCNHKYVPTYNSVFFAMHIGRTRYMKCPKCSKRSWNKKRIN